MHTWLAAPWQIALSAVVPVAMAILLFVLEQRGPLAKAIQSSTGLVPSYFGAVAVIFGLFAALLASDAWRKETMARTAVEAEADAVRMIAHQARVAGIEAQIVPRLKSYIAAASAELPSLASIEVARGKTDTAFEDLLATITRNSSLDATSRSLLSGSAQGLQKAHDDRLHLATDETSFIKWISIVVFGGITQIALLLVHVGNRRGQRIAVGLFTAAFSFCLVVMAIFDSPFETILAQQPGAALSAVLRTF